MTIFTVLKFPTAGGAARMLRILQKLQEEQRQIHIEDGAIVTWPLGARHPRIKQLNDLAGIGALGGGFWGMLFGLLFSVSFFGVTTGTVIGALAGHFAHYGIDEDFIKGVRNQLTEDTSALFLLTSDAVLDKVVASIKSTPFELMSTSLSYEQEAQLREVFGQESLVY
jgi:uncharacterized membrane protein